MVQVQSFYLYWFIYITMAQKKTRRYLTMGKEPPLVLQFFWGGNFFLKVFWILLLMVQVALFYLYSFGYNIFLKMMGKNFQIRMSPSPLHARAIISNRGPTFLHEHWFPLIFWGNFFLKIFWILLLMVQVASFYLYSFGYNIFLKMMGKNQFLKHNSICCIQRRLLGRTPMSSVSRKLPL